MSSTSIIANAIGVRAHHICICLKAAAILALALLAAEAFLGWPVPEPISRGAKTYLAGVIVLWLLGLPKADPPPKPKPSSKRARRG